MIPHKTLYQNASVFPLFSRKTSENTRFQEKMRDFVFPLFSQNREKSEVETSRLLTKMAKKLDTTYKSARFGNCTYALILDKRHPKKDKNTFPVVMRYTIDRKSWYNFVAGEFTEEDFAKVCNLSAKAVRSELYDKKIEFDAIFEKQVELIERLGNSLTLDRIKAAITGVDTSKEASFFSVWQDRINFFRTNNNGEQYTTAESYECAMKSFQKILWDRPITGFKVGKEDIEYWSNGMQNGVLNENGELIGQIREATRGLYLRNCRAVWNECVSRGYLTNQEYPFSNVKKKKLVAIPVGDTRKDHYLNVQQMTELYRVFVDKRYPDTWKKDYAEKAHYSLGLFLAQYLCNGFNMADAGELKYSQFYFDTGRKAFKFKRVKTRNRTEGGGEVIIPIIEPLQRVLDEIAAEPVLNGFVFPDILQGATHKADKRKRISQENSNVQDRVIKICEDVLHWEVRPSGTWCRHSYGTNLTHAKVEDRYISQSMGHATDKTITERYIAQYPLETMFEFNNKLLDLQPKVTEEDIKNMTEEQKTEMLLKLLANK